MNPYIATISMLAVIISVTCNVPRDCPEEVRVRSLATHDVVLAEHARRTSEPKLVTA